MKITLNNNENCPPCESKSCEHYSGLADKVLELNGGTYKDFIN